MSEQDGRLRRPRIAAAVAAAALFAAVGIVLALTTPWNPLPGPVPGGRTPPDPSADFSSAEAARSAAFDAAITPPAYAGLAAGLVVLLLLGLTPLGARLIRWATSRVPGGPRHDRAEEPGHGRRSFRWVRRVVSPQAVRVLAATLTVTTLLWLVGLPFDVWGEVVLRDYGLSTQSWGAWSVDELKSLGLTWVIYGVALLLLYAVVRRFPRYWWAGAAAGGCTLVIAVSFIYPVAVEPVFNKFHSLPDGRLRTELLAMAERDGVPVDDVLVADASRRTTSLNAYVSGFGSTRRIVLYDTLLESPPRRVESIVGHELGHAADRDVLWGTLVGAFAVAGALCLLYPLMTSPRLLRRAGVAPRDGADGGTAGGAADPRSLALVLALVAVGMQVGAPVQNLVSRRVEARADVHALDLTRDPRTFVSMQHELSVRNISDLAPNALERVLWMTHPAGPDRIAMARDWARLHGTRVPPLRPGG